MPPNASTLPQNTPTAPPTGGSTLDPEIVNLARSIRDVESKGNFSAIGKSGEYGAYQFTQPTWDSVAPGVLGKQVPYNQATPLEQNAVAYHYIKSLKDQGYNAGQIASIWNSGKPDPTGKVGTNTYGANYDTPSYVNNVYQKYLGYKNGTIGTQTGLPTYGASFPYQPDDSPITAGFKAFGNLPSSVYGFGANIVQMLAHPLQTLGTLAQGAEGGIAAATGHTGDNPQADQAWNQIATSLKERYGSLEALSNTAVNDPFGLGADLAGIIFPAAGALGKGAEAADLASRVGQTVTRPIGAAASKVASAPFSVLGSADDAALAASARTGINLPAGAYSSSPLVRGAESFAMTGAGNEQMMARVTNATDQMDALAKTIVDSTNGIDDLSAAGQNISKGLKNFEGVFKKTTGTLYDEIQQTAGDVAAQTNNSRAILDKIMFDKESIADTSNLKFFKDKYAVLTGGKTEMEFIPEGTKVKSVPGKQYPAPTFDTIKRMRTAVGEILDTKFLDPFVKQHYGQLKQLYGGLTQDLRDTIKATRDPQLLRMYDNANQAYIQGRRVITSQYARTIARLANDGKYSAIVSALIKPSTAVEDIPRIMAVAGKQGANDIRATFLKKVFEDARNAEGDFTPQGINRVLKKYGDDRMGAILTPQQLQGVKDLGTLTKALGDSLKMSQGSQTAFLLRTAAEMGAVGSGMIALVSGNLPLAAKLIGGVLGAEGASYFLASSMGQRFLIWGLTRGSEFAKTANSMGIEIPPEDGTVGGNGNTGSPDSGLHGGGPADGGSGGAPGAGTTEGVSPVLQEPGLEGQLLGDGEDSTGSEGKGGIQAGSGAIGGGQKGDGVANGPLTSKFTAKTLSGRIKEGLQNYLENFRPGLVAEDVTKGNQQFNIGLTSVKGRISTAFDDLTTEADNLYKKGDFEAAQKKYNEALAQGTNTLSQAFEGTGIKVKPRGVGFGVYGDTLEPNYDAVAVVPRGKEELFHYILSDVADNKFHQYSMLTYRYAPKDAAFGVVDAQRGISYEPHLRFNLEKPLTAADVATLTKTATEAGVGGLSLREGGKAIDIINLTKYNDDYETFSANAEKFAENLKRQGFSGEAEVRTSEARFLGSDPGQGHGSTGYKEYRDNFRAQNPGFFNADEAQNTSKVIERIRNKEAVSRSELEQITKQQDVTPMERSVVLDALTDAENGGAKKVPVKELVARIEGKSLPVSVYETDSYAQYGLDNVGLDYMPSKGENPKTLVFETPVEHGNQGHFNNSKHFGHTRVLITEEGGKKIGYINEVQSDVFQKADLTDNLVENSAYSKIKQEEETFKAKQNALDADEAMGKITGTQRLERSRAIYGELQLKIQELKAKAAENMTPQQQQLLHQSKGDRYVDTLLRGTLQYFDKQGVDEVRLATPSSIAKIEGYINEDGLAPYEVNGQRAHDGMDDLKAGQAIDYGGEEYTVVKAENGTYGTSGSITVAPSDNVNSFDYDSFIRDEMEYHWGERVVFDLKDRKVGKNTITDEADLEKLTTKQAQKMLDSENSDFDMGDEYLQLRSEGFDHEEAKNKMSNTFEEWAHESINDVYGDRAFISYRRGKYETPDKIYVVDEGTNTENFSQPSGYSGGLDSHESQNIDPRPDDNYNTSDINKEIDANFDKTHATVLKGYVKLFDNNLRKLAKEQNIPIKYVENSDSTWYEIPMTKTKRYLFGS